MRFTFLLFFFLGFCSSHIHAEQKPIIAQKKVLTIDSGAVDVRKINAEAVKKYAKDKDFIYNDVAPETLSLWDRFWMKFWQIMRKIFSSKGTGLVLNYGAIIIAIIAFSYIIIKLLGADLIFFSKKSKAIEVPFTESLENIHEIDFEEQINAAVQGENYRLAVRLIYLKTLKTLSDKNIIHWLPEKTNQAYVLEIENLNNQKEFKTLTNQFEYIWYGEFYIDKNNFNIVQQSFQQFNQKLL
jgi:hypothetical protein